MPESARTQKAADAIALHLEKLILEGVLRPGEKLAPERNLAEALNVSRPTLRDALAKLAGKGLLETSRAGTSVAKFLAPLMAPLAALLTENPRVTDDYLEFRRIVESEAAALSAKRATEPDQAAIRQCLARMSEAHKLDDPKREAEADVDLHQLIHEACHNVVVLHIMRALSELLRADIFYNRQQLYLRAGVRDELLAQHTAVANAILSGKADEARAAMTRHINFTYDTVAELRLNDLRLEASLHRVGRSELLARQD